ncbi:hypothetical protein [Streptomyces sp. NPDC005799]|uniref:hypothetical protein n=1 Tax=Streptomyces sp. NPDC005799 TaxID=3154678 RepID=UPI0033F966A7
MAVTVLVVNFRHVFYASSFPLHPARHLLARRLLAEETADAQHFVPDRRPGDRPHPRPALLGIGVYVVLLNAL